MSIGVGLGRGGGVNPGSLFERVGGQPFFDRLVGRFYDGVGADPVLRPLYPTDAGEYEASQRWLALFFGQYWGGPQAYSEERGHPRLRMRHAAFVVGEAQRDAWLRHMVTAIDTAGAEGLDPADAGQLVAYVTSAAEFLRND